MSHQERKESPLRGRQTAWKKTREDQGQHVTFEEKRAQHEQGEGDGQKGITPVVIVDYGPDKSQNKDQPLQKGSKGKMKGGGKGKRSRPAWKASKFGRPKGSHRKGVGKASKGSKAGPPRDESLPPQRVVMST